MPRSRAEYDEDLAERLAALLLAEWRRRTHAADGDRVDAAADAPHAPGTEPTPADDTDREQANAPTRRES